MTASWQSLLWKLLLSFPMLTVWVVAYFASSAVAQITPDRSLGSEGSQITPLSPNIDRIGGGAVRGTNLFHSFQDFNIGEGRGAYFANPAGIENILSRVTGGNPSRIFGTLGVLGNANLYLLNPNGIIFGANAKLDIRGSFVASTAGGLLFNDRTLYGVNESQTTPLLTMAVPVGLQYGTQQAGNIHNAGNLAVGQGQKLALVGGTVTSSGQLIAPGGTVQVLGDRVGLLDNARIDVSGETGGGTVLIGGDFQGKGEVPNAARTFVGSGVTINADALSSGNGGRVIVWADEVAGFYGNISARGGKNSGNGGFVEVSGKQNLIFDGKVDLSATNGSFGTLLLDPTDIIIGDTGSNNDQLTDRQILQGEGGTASFTISAAALQKLPSDAEVILQATNNIKIDSSITFAPRTGVPGTGSITFQANADSIGSGEVVMKPGTSIGTGGRNIDISGTSLSLGNIDTSASDTFGGNIILKATNGIITAGILDASSRTPKGVVNGAEVRITSLNGLISLIGRNEQGNTVEGKAITINTPSTLSVDGFLNARNDTPGIAGSIFIGNDSVPPTSITVGGISTRNFGGGDGGKINVTTTGLLKINDFSPRNNENPVGSTNQITNRFSIGSEADGNAGTIDINANGGIDTVSGIISNSRQSGNGGNITLNSSNDAVKVGYIDTSSAKKGGSITISSFGDTTTSFITTAPSNSNQVADVSIKSRSGSIYIPGFNNEVDKHSVFARSIKIDTPGTLFINGFLNARTDTLGDAGEVTIGGTKTLTPSSVTLAGISTRNLRGGRGGNITINTSGSLNVTGAFSRDSGLPVNPDAANSASIGSEASGNGGPINIIAGGDITTAAGIFSDSRISGNGGDITLISQSGTINTTAGILNASAVRPIPLRPFFGLPVGNGGNITLDAKGGNILSGSIESTGLQGGSITLNSGGKISLNQADIVTITTRLNTGNNITLSANQVDLNDARIVNIKDGEGQGGNIFINASDSVKIVNNGGSSSAEVGSEIFKYFKQIPALQGTGLASTTLQESFLGAGNTGDITIETNKLTIQATGNARGQTGISTLPLSDGNAGNISIKATDSVEILGNKPGAFNPAINVADRKAAEIQSIPTGITSATVGSGNAGAVNIDTGNLTIKDTAAITTGVTKFGAGRGNNLTVKASSVTLTGKAVLATATRSSNLQSEAGNLNIDANQVTLSDGALIATDTLGAGKGGNLNINTNELKILGGSRVGASTFRGGQGGTVTINSPPQKKAQIVNIDGILSNSQLPEGDQAHSGIFADSPEGKGQAGNINIYTDNLNVLNRGEVSVSGFSLGRAGDINVTAGNIFMTQQAGIRATTSSSEGGNIKLSVANDLWMINDGNPNFATEITAKANGVANGGNITLRVGKFIRGRLSDNNDIVAEADAGNGGRIDAKAAGSFFFVQHEKGLRVPESEYIASSFQGLNGIVNVSTQDFQPIPIPDVPIVRQVPQVCPTSPGVTTRPAGRSAFSNAGRGGLPPNPGDALESNIVQVPWVTLDSENTNTTGATSSTPATNQKPEAIAEAEGWQKLPNGKVIFTTKNSSSPLPPCILESSQQ